MQFGAIVERASVDEAYIDLTNLVNDRMSQYDLSSDGNPLWTSCLKNKTFIVGHETENSKEEWIRDITGLFNTKCANFNQNFWKGIFESFSQSPF